MSTCSNSYSTRSNYHVWLFSSVDHEKNETRYDKREIKGAFFDVVLLSWCRNRSAKQKRINMFHNDDDSSIVPLVLIMMALLAIESKLICWTCFPFLLWRSMGYLLFGRPFLFTDWQTMCEMRVNKIMFAFFFLNFAYLLRAVQERYFSMVEKRRWRNISFF